MLTRQVIGAGEQVFIERAQYAQHANGLFAARIKRVDLGALDRCAAFFGQRDKRLVPNRAQQMAMQFDLRDCVEKCPVERRDVDACA